MPQELPLPRVSELQVPFGAVYFRKSNPPREDWERDYAVAAADGLNIFRHWFMWAAIERAPGKYDWDDYDRHMDLAAKHGIRTIIAELTHTVPDWAMRKFAHARQLRGDGTPLPSVMGTSSATGGFANNGGGAGALTMNCPEVKEAAGAFLTALATRYRDHPGMYGYDVWNETNYSPAVDYNPYTKAAFRDWLKAKYATLDDLAEAWHRYGHAEWDDVEPPVQVGPYPECLDWLAFKRDNFYGQMQWRIDTIRAVDPKNLIAAHGVASAIPDMAAKGCDDWLAASKVEVFGYTWIQARKGSQSWRNFYGGDITRAAVARQALLARRAPGRPALDAAAGAEPRQGGRPRRRARGHPRLVADVLRRRRPRHAEPALPPAARRPALRRLRLLRHGRLPHPALRHGSRPSPAGPTPPSRRR